MSQFLTPSVPSGNCTADQSLPALLDAAPEAPSPSSSLALHSASWPPSDSLTASTACVALDVSAECSLPGDDCGMVSSGCAECGCLSAIVLLGRAELGGTWTCAGTPAPCFARATNAHAAVAVTATAPSIAALRLDDPVPCDAAAAEVPVAASAADSVCPLGHTTSCQSTLRQRSKYEPMAAGCKG